MKERKKIEIVNYEVPRDMCPRIFLTTLKGSIEGACLYISQGCVMKMITTCDAATFPNSKSSVFCWDETEENSAATIYLNDGKPWHIAKKVEAADISYDVCPKSPKKVVFVKMEGEVA
jgi:hypothetical protein